MQFQAVALLAVVALAPVESRCQAIFNTFGPAETFNAALPGLSVGAGVLGAFTAAEGGITMAIPFTPSQAAHLSRLDLGMQYRYDPVKASGPANLDVTIASDQHGLPGAAIETIHLTGALGGIASAVGIVSANSVAQPFLQTGVQYWIVLAPPDLRNTTFQWFGTGQPGLKGFVISKVQNTPWQGRPAYETALAFAVFGTQSAGPQPAVATGAVVDAAGFRPTISLWPWMTIFGTNLSAFTRPWQASDFTGSSLPLSLDDVGVQIDGYAAAVSYVSPGQINAQVPDGVGPGSVTVQVISPSGPSTLAQVDTEPYAPAFFTVSSGGTAYVAATGLDGAMLGGAARPARPGDMISLYGTGFGPLRQA